MFGDLKAIVRFYVSDRMTWLGCGYTLVLIGVVLLTALAIALGTTALGQEPDPAKAERDRRARSVLALTESDPATVAAAAKCDCTKARILDWREGSAKAIREKMPLVIFAGIEPRCCGDAVPVRMTLADSGFSPARPIVVYAPSADGKALETVKQLPATATPAEIKAAVAEAKRRITGLPPKP